MRINKIERISKISRELPPKTSSESVKKTKTETTTFQDNTDTVTISDEARAAIREHANWTPEQWEHMLQDSGMPSEISSEEEIAFQAGVKLESLDMETDPDVQALTKRLTEEDSGDSLNHFGGFPNSVEDMFALVETLRAEWLKQNIPSKDIRLIVHTSCINGHDCVALTHSGKDIYHYSTKNIYGYTREKLTEKFQNHHLAYIEK
jgi:hypothetical protein